LIFHSSPSLFGYDFGWLLTLKRLQFAIANHIDSQFVSRIAEMTADTSKPGDANMILIMGVTGSGKSYLINQLAGRQVVEESDQLDSCKYNHDRIPWISVVNSFQGTAVCQAVPIEVGKTKVLLIDTPGFDDSERSDTEILTEISKLLAAQYKLGVNLKGVIYLHRITDNRYQGSSVRTL